MNENAIIFSGSSSPVLSQAICKSLHVPLGQGEYRTYPDGNSFVKVGENVRGRHVFIIQSTIHPTNDRFMELLFWVDAFKRASASAVTAVIPYFSYGKGDKKDEPRVSIRARVCADALEAVGCDRVITFDLHSPQIQGFFKIPVDNLFGLYVLGKSLFQDCPKNWVVVAADTGFADEARQFADYLGVPIAISVKQRVGAKGQAKVVDIIGEVEGKVALIVDDFVISGSTLIEDAQHLRKKGAKEVMAAVTHGVFSLKAMSRLKDSALDRLYITDSVENRLEPLIDKISVVSIAPYLGEAIRRISEQESISAMFPRAHKTTISTQQEGVWSK